MESSNFVEWCVDQLLNTKNNYKIIVTTIILYVQKSNKNKDGFIKLLAVSLCIAVTLACWQESRKKVLRTMAIYLKHTPTYTFPGLSGLLTHRGSLPLPRTRFLCSVPVNMITVWWPETQQPTATSSWKKGEKPATHSFPINHLTRYGSLTPPDLEALPGGRRRPGLDAKVSP